MRQRLITRFLELARERLERLNNDVVALELGTTDPDLGPRLLRELHTLKGEARMTGFAEISEESHQLEDLLGSARDTRWRPDRSVFEQALAGLDRISQLIAEAEPPTADEAVAVTVAAPPATEVIRVRSEKLERQSEHVADLLLAQARDERALARLQERFHSSTSALQSVRDLLRQIRLDQQVRPQQLREVDQMLEALFLVGRQIREALAELGDSAFDRRSLVASLDEDVRDLRLMPVSQLFARFPRSIRDLAAAQGKDVRVVLQGEEVEVDKQVLDLIAEPLLHILRNAVDHGIESPEARAAAQKLPQAVITLAAQQVGQRVEISVTDDGPGLNHDAIRAKAIATGLLNPDEARDISPTRLADLIFRPSFSTREGVTELSGRGVGLEVVRERLEAGQGQVRVQSWPGVGTRFILTVPTTMVLARALLARVGPHVFAIPSEAVVAALTAGDEHISRRDGALHLDWEDISVPISDLGSALGLEPASSPSPPLAVVVVRHLHERQALAVTKILGEQQVVHRALDRLASSVPTVQGAVVLPDGQLALVLSIRQILAQLELNPQAPWEKPTKHALHVLVVEDSVLTRDLLRNTLSLAGFDVSEAADGAKAVGMLRGRRPDVILTDLDMPQMDGLELIRWVRANPDLQDLPILVFSTRASAEDREQATLAGATDYLAKSQFREADLVRRLRSLLGQDDRVD